MPNSRFKIWLLLGVIDGRLGMMEVSKRGLTVPHRFSPSFSGSRSTMYLRLAKRFLFETDKRLLAKAAWILGVKGLLRVHRHKRRLKRGEFFPPFLYLSVINSCNLRCQGCWVDVAAKQEKIEVDAVNETIRQAKAKGNSFFGILGGEPFMHKDLLEIFRQNRDVYFQVFTNGHFITDEVAAELKRCGNVTPLISVEGTEIISDQRRGRDGVLNQTMKGLETALKHNLLVGVCTSVCKTNLDDLVRDAWVDRLIEKRKGKGYVYP